MSLFLLCAVNLLGVVTYNRYRLKAKVRYDDSGKVSLDTLCSSESHVAERSVYLIDFFFSVPPI